MRISMKQSIGAKALIVPTPVWVVGTYDHGGKPNVMTADWGGICCSKPPCVAIAVQKIRYTYLLTTRRSELITPSVNLLEKHLASGRRSDKAVI
jgi:flavin reductase (DIM6/NTAB) family NADH-FMN oxidoreductase RutF